MGDPRNLRDRYLWDKSAPPDPFVARLEGALAEKRKWVLGAGHDARASRRRANRPRAHRVRKVAAVALVAVGATVLWLCFADAGDSAGGTGSAPDPVVIAGPDASGADLADQGEPKGPAAEAASGASQSEPAMGDPATSDTFAPAAASGAAR